jgi:hypothetical protein
MHIEADRELAETARAQHWIFTSQQALDAGHLRWRIEYRRKCGMWVRIHPNVYTHASTPSTWHRDQMAAVMWAQLAASSARAAAFLHGLPGFDDPPLRSSPPAERSFPDAASSSITQSACLGTRSSGCTASLARRSSEPFSTLCGTVGTRQGAIAMDHTLLQRLASLGYQTIYVTWADATSSSSLTLMTIERALRERGWTPSAGSQEVAEYVEKRGG